MNHRTPTMTYLLNLTHTTVTGDATVRNAPKETSSVRPLTFSVIPTAVRTVSGEQSRLGTGRRGERVAGGPAPRPMHAARATFGKNGSRPAKSYEPFPFANMALNSPFASPLIPSVK